MSRKRWWTLLSTSVLGTTENAVDIWFLQHPAWVYLSWSVFQMWILRPRCRVANLTNANIGCPWPRGVAQLTEFLPGVQKAPGLIPITAGNGHGWHIPTIPVLGRWRQKNHKFKIIRGCTVSLKPAWDYMRPFSEDKTQHTNIAYLFKLKFR